MIAQFPFPLSHLSPSPSRPVPLPLIPYIRNLLNHPLSNTIKVPQMPAPLPVPGVLDASRSPNSMSLSLPPPSAFPMALTPSLPPQPAPLPPLIVNYLKGFIDGLAARIKARLNEVSSSQPLNDLSSLGTAYFPPQPPSLLPICPAPTEPLFIPLTFPSQP